MERGSNEFAVKALKNHYGEWLIGLAVIVVLYVIA